MDLNASFDERVSVHAARVPWKVSPTPGVERSEILLEGRIS